MTKVVHFTAITIIWHAFQFLTVLLIENIWHFFLGVDEISCCTFFIAHHTKMETHAKTVLKYNFHLIFFYSISKRITLIFDFLFILKETFYHLH